MKEATTSDIGALDEHAVCLRRAAEAAGIQVSTAPGDLWSDKHLDQPWLRIDIGSDIYYNRNQKLMRVTAAGTAIENINGRAINVTPDKHRVKMILAAEGIPCPPGALFRSADLAEALRYAADLPGEICVKPNRGSLGDLVFPQLRRAEAIVEACAAVASAYDEILIEASLAGEVWRYFYVQPDIVGRMLCRPASVLGDGANSIAALIAQKQAEASRRNIIGHTDIPDGHARAFMLTRQGLNPASIVPAGRRVFLHPASNAAMGADSLGGITDLHPGYADWVRRACAAIPDLLVASIDVIIPHRQAPPTGKNFAVLEINSSPGLLMFHYPWEGPPCDVASAIIGLLRRLARRNAW